MVYVTSLPGGPENPSLGARGAVYRVNPATGSVTRIGSGFTGATGLAISPAGRIYVAELFGNQISALNNGGPQPLVNVNAPAALEWANGKLYATIDAFGSGAVVTISP